MTVGDTVRELTRGQSIDIPLGERHRLENFGADDVELIEVQFGDYLGEDDIVRYDDVYNRV
ncbi:Alginate biosynthesis protein AlgA [compost metagenome]